MHHLRLLPLGVALAAGAFFFVPLPAAAQVRTEVELPAVLGYTIMRCDFHMHTVFSDGNVWPTVRVREAWTQGLDAFAISDHIEYTPHKDDVKVDFNRSYELAKGYAKSLDLLFVKSAEITRKLPQGHYCTLFIKDAAPLKVDDFFGAIKAAIDQEAFVIWNHPSFQNPKGICEWFDVQTQLLEKGWLHGIEVVNGLEYYPESHKWCLEKKLTMIASSDVHDPLQREPEYGPDAHRPMTLVLVKDRTMAGLKEALFARRTIVYAEKLLIGEAQYLEGLFRASIAVINPSPKIAQKGRAVLQLRNAADVEFELVLKENPKDFTATASVAIPRESMVTFGVSAKEGAKAGARKVSIPYTVKNLLVAPATGLSTTIDFELEVLP